MFNNSIVGLSSNLLLCLLLHVWLINLNRCTKSWMRCLHVFDHQILVGTLKMKDIIPERSHADFNAIYGGQTYNLNRKIEILAASGTKQAYVRHLFTIK